VQRAAGGVPKLALTNPCFGDLDVPAGVNLPLQLPACDADSDTNPALSGMGSDPKAGIAYLGPCP